MPRCAIQLENYNPESWSSLYYTDPQHLEYVVRNRDIIRTRLGETAGMSNVVASDTFRWVNGLYTGRACVLLDKDRDAAFVIGFPGIGSSSSPPDIDNMWGGSGSNLRTHVKSGIVTGNGSTAPPNGWVFFYISDWSAAVSGGLDLEFDDPVNLTYTGGDDYLLTVVSPHTIGGLALFRPATEVYGCSLDQALSAGFFTYAGLWLCYDSDFETLKIASTNNLQTFRYVDLLGRHGNPAAGNTDNRAFTKFAGQPTSNSFMDLTVAETYAFDAGGTLREYDCFPQDVFDRFTYKIQSGPFAGQLDWRPLEVTNGSGGSGAYGWLKPEMAIEALPFAHGMTNLHPIDVFTEDMPMVKEFESHGTFWEKGRPLPFTNGKGDPF